MNKHVQIDGQRKELQETHLEQRDGVLILRTQSMADRGMLAPLCPYDQTRTFLGHWIDGELHLSTAATTAGPAPQAPAAPDPKLAAEIAELAKMKNADLQTYAAELGVAWDDHATRDTNVLAVAVASLAAARPR